MRKTARVINLTEVAPLNRCPRVLHMPVETVVFCDHGGAPVFLRRSHDFCRVLGVCRHGLLNQHMFPRVERIDRDGRMKIIGERNRDGVDIRLFKQFPVIGISTRYVKPLGSFPQSLRMGFRDGHGGSRDDGGKARSGGPVVPHRRRHPFRRPGIGRSAPTTRSGAPPGRVARRGRSPSPTAR